MLKYTTPLNLSYWTSPAQQAKFAPIHLHWWTVWDCSHSNHSQATYSRCQVQQLKTVWAANRRAQITAMAVSVKPHLELRLLSAKFSKLLCFLSSSNLSIHLPSFFSFYMADFKKILWTRRRVFQNGRQGLSKDKIHTELSIFSLFQLVKNRR